MKYSTRSPDPLPVIAAVWGKSWTVGGRWCRLRPHWPCSSAATCQYWPEVQSHSISHYQKYVVFLTNNITSESVTTLWSFVEAKNTTVWRLWASLNNPQAVRGWRRSTSLVSWFSLASLTQSVSSWTSLSRLEVIFFTARKVSPARPESDSRNTRAETRVWLYIDSPWQWQWQWQWQL